MTVLTTNRSLSELGELLGASVADRLTGGLVLKFIDQSQRDMDKALPEGFQDCVPSPTMPNPTMDPDLAHIPYVAPEEVDPDEMAAAIVVSLDAGPTMAPTGPVAVRSSSMFPPRPDWGVWDE